MPVSNERSRIHATINMLFGCQGFFHCLFFYSSNFFQAEMNPFRSNDKCMSRHFITWAGISSGVMTCVCELVGVTSDKVAVE